MDMVEMQRQVPQALYNLLVDALLENARVQVKPRVAKISQQRRRPRHCGHAGWWGR